MYSPNPFVERQREVPAEPRFPLSPPPRRKARPALPHRPDARQPASSLESPAASDAAALTTPSPGWKDALKRGCIERARQKRRDIVLQARRRSGALSSSVVGRDGGEAEDDETGAERDPFSAEEATRLVEEELRASGVGVSPSVAPSGPACSGRSPLRRGSPGAVLVDLSEDGLTVRNPPSEFPGQVGESRYDGQYERSAASMDLFDDVVHEGGVGVDEEHVISEQELYDLMQEVEDELQREEALLMEDMQEMERRQIEEMEHMQEQIADYEQWQHVGESTAETSASLDHQRYGSMCEENSERVLCPVCSGAYLVQTPANVILCPRAVAATSKDVPYHCLKGEGNAQTCDLRLDVTDEGLTLSHLREQLRLAYEEHAIVCSGELQFQVKKAFGVTTLAAGCKSCDSNVFL